MKKVKQTPKYHSPLREAQAEATRAKIAEAGIKIFNTSSGLEELTFKAVAKEAGVTEMTVYRYFPNREDLLSTLFAAVGSKMGVRMPESVQDMIDGTQRLYQGYESQAAIMEASLASKQGKEIRMSFNSKKQKAFLKIAEDLNPKLSTKEKKQIAAILSVLYSSHTWDALRTYWNMNPKEMAETVRLAIDPLITSAKKKE